MRQLKYLTFFIAIVLGVSDLAAQIVLNNNPASLKWMQINTDRFRIIYPTTFESEAQRTANILQHLYGPASSTMGVEPKKVSIILQNQTTVSNGFVTLGPRRSEFFTTAPQNHNLVGTNDWLEFLALHEFRHIAQFSKSKTGINQLAHTFFGEQSHNLMAVFATPTWFWEGDAVGIETALTRSGRGRTPRFDLEFRTNLLERGAFTYNKQYLRSFKHFVPDHYRLGFYYTTYMRKKHGPEIWGKIMKDANYWSILPFTFSRAIKKYTGKGARANYNEMMAEMKQIWQQQQEGLEVTESDQVNVRSNKIFTNYSYPQLLEDGRVLVQKSGQGDITTFVALGEDGSETKLFIPGQIADNQMLTSGGGRIIWNEHEFDPRWPLKDYSEIKVFDIASGKHYRTNKSRYKGVAISPDGKKVVAQEITEDNTMNLVVFDLDIFVGSEANVIAPLKRPLPNPENAAYAMPRWSDNGSEIVVLKTKDVGKTIAIVNPETGEERNLYPYSHENVTHPVKQDNFVLYNSPYSGIDNIYAIDVTNGNRFQVTSGKYGTYNPSVSQDGSLLLYNDFARDGMEVKKTAYDPSQWKPISEVQDRDVRYYQTIVEQEGHEDLFDDVPSERFNTRPYRRVSGILKPVSWGPFANSTTREVSFGVTTQDVLSTSNFRVAYVYDIDDEEGTVSARWSYQGFYPILDIEASYGNRSTNEVFRDTTGTIQQAKLEWNEMGYKAGFRIPLNLTKNRFSTRFSIGNYVGVTRVMDYENNFNQNGRNLVLPAYDLVGEGSLLENEFEFQFTSLMKVAQRDINPKFGGYLTFERFGTPYGGDFDGGLTAVRAGIYLPGAFKHHSILLQGGFQTRKITFGSTDYWFPNRIEFPRGFGASAFENYTFGAINYALPVLYPEIALGPLLYIQRVKMNFFFDGAQGRSEAINFDILPGFAVGGDRTINYYSLGVETTFDFNAMRFFVPFDLGFRVLYKNDPFGTGENFAVEFVLADIGF